MFWGFSTNENPLNKTAGLKQDSVGDKGPILVDRVRGSGSFDLLVSLMLEGYYPFSSD